MARLSDWLVPYFSSLPSSLLSSLSSQLLSLFLNCLKQKRQQYKINVLLRKWLLKDILGLQNKIMVTSQRLNGQNCKPGNNKNCLIGRKKHVYYSNKFQSFILYQKGCSMEVILKIAKTDLRLIKIERHIDHILLGYRG